jgi:Protein of unknown function (DUF2920)
MSKDYQLSWPAHPNVYQDKSSRELTLYFSEPEQGVNKDTGILLLIPGFGGTAHSNVYKKMRSTFADTYNLVTVQCDYFGQEFMQGSSSATMNFSKEDIQQIFTSAEMEEIYSKGFNVNKFIDIGSRYDINVHVKEALKESPDNFNDMGIMQAIDNLTAVYYIMEILKDNNLTFNTKKIILFGQSHGAYLSYLCNALAPNLFSLLIDNSAWLFPTYLNSSRYLTHNFGKMTLTIEFDYLAKKLNFDKEFLSLPTLYRYFDNKCKIECFHGIADNLISHIDKREFCNGIENCEYHEISDSKLDGLMFKSAGHGLDADFLKLFEHVMENRQFETGTDIHFYPVKIKTANTIYELHYENGIPIIALTNSTSRV